MNILRSKLVAETVGFHPVHSRRLVNAGSFPKPIQLGPKSVGWIEEEVDGWIEERVKERDEKTEATGNTNGQNSNA